MPLLRPLLTAREGISGLGRGPNTTAPGGATLRRLLYRRSGLLRDNRPLEEDGLPKEERLPEERLSKEDGFLGEDGLLDGDRLRDGWPTRRDWFWRGGGRRDWLRHTRAYGGGDLLRNTYYWASARNPSEAYRRPDRRRPKFDVYRTGAFLFGCLFGGGFLLLFLLRFANGYFLPFGDLLLHGSGLLFRNGLFLSLLAGALHVLRLRRLG